MIPRHPSIGEFPFEDANRNLVEAAIRNEEIIAQAAREMRELESKLADRIKGLPDWVSKEVERWLAVAVDRTAAQITIRLTDANDAAEKAKARYENAARFAPWGVAWVALACFLTGCLGMIAGVYMSARVILPAPDILQRQREAEQALVTLAAKGGKSILTHCSIESGQSRLCIRTDEQGGRLWGDHGETYRVIYGY